VQRSIAHKNLSHRNLTKYKITQKEVKYLSRISDFSEVSSLESIIFGSGNSNIKWRPCLEALFIDTFPKDFQAL
jgi:hypothetical protein